MTGISQEILFVALPYAAVALFIGGAIWRFRSPLDIAARSSQMLERRWLSMGTIPFHIGLCVLLIGHLVPLLFPATWVDFVSRRGVLLSIETAGLAAALLAAGGAAILLVRRLSLPLVRAASHVSDVLVVAILIIQFALGIAVALTSRWGALWSAVTLMPYLRSLVLFRPDITLVAGMPWLVTAHLTGAWVVLALIPFTRLVHVFSLPLGYLVRRPQKVVWTTVRPKAAATINDNPDVRAVGDLAVEGR